MQGTHILGAIAAVFALALLILPTVRVAQGSIPARKAIGLWISGAGFLALASAAFLLAGAAARVAVLLGVLAAVAGNIVQRKVARPDR